MTHGAMFANDDDDGDDDNVDDDVVLVGRRQPFAKNIYVDIRMMCFYCAGASCGFSVSTECACGARNDL